jgi:C-terminal processing protease CtpA/Prc
MTPRHDAPRTRPIAPRRTAILVTLAACTALAFATAEPAPEDAAALFAETFDAHWEALRDDYPYFELYDVDWDAERAHHRPRALAAENADEFAWELARLISSLPDPHVSFIPAMSTIMGRWSYPELETKMIERRAIVLAWPEDMDIALPPAYADAPHAYPEIIEVQGEVLKGTAEILAAGPLGSLLDIRLRWPDGTEMDLQLPRPDESNLPPPSKHHGDRWLVTGRVGSVGYMKVKTFDPKMGTMGPDGKMTTMLRAVLRELDDTDGLILDLQGNGGGLVAASDPFLGNLVTRTQRYRWGNSDGQTRVISPRSPRYRGEIVAVVDQRSASGGEWAARILRDAGRATVVGGRTAGAEAAVHTSDGPDGSKVSFSAWPMVEPGVTPFQETGIELDHAFPLTIEDVRAHGYDEALARVRRARFGKALEVLGAPADDLDALLAMADEADLTVDEVAAKGR